MRLILDPSTPTVHAGLKSDQFFQIALVTNSKQSDALFQMQGHSMEKGMPGATSTRVKGLSILASRS